jgi:hypothetical protein
MITSILKELIESSIIQPTIYANSPNITKASATKFSQDSQVASKPFATKALSPYCLGLVIPDARSDD